MHPRQILADELIQPPGRECGKNVLFATNDPNLAARFASYALSLTAQGSVLQGSIGKVMTESDLSYACARRLAHREAVGGTLFTPE